MGCGDGAVIVLSIGTSHPWNVAGTGRDLVIGARYGARVFTTLAAVSAQDGRGVAALHAEPLAIVRAQLDTLPWNGAGAARIGALGNAPNVSAVVEALRAHPELPAIVDPVFAASRGGELVDQSARIAVRDQLAALPNVILTPNISEAGELLGRSVVRETIAQNATELQRRGVLAVLIKGGHLNGDPLDVLATTAGIEYFSEPRIAGCMHGIGCTLAMSLACEIASGSSIPDAVRAARAFVRAEIARH